MATRRSKPSSGRASEAGPSQRQLRAGELVRHALAEALREIDIQDPAVAGVSVTVTEVRTSPDLRHATVFVEPLGAGMAGRELRPKGGSVQAQAVVDGLNRAARFLRGELGRRIDLKFTPDLHFVHDPSFDAAAHMDALFRQPDVARDLAVRGDDPEAGADEGAA